MQRFLVALAVLAMIGPVQAKAPFVGTDFSGVYDCTGSDDHEGRYTGVATLKLVPGQSTGKYAAYSFRLDVLSFGTYLGQAAGLDKELAIHFAHTDPGSKDYGTGIATFSRGKGRNGKWSFRKYYYEPEYMGGNFGIEDCVRR